MLKRFVGFWTQEHNLSILLVVLVVELFVLIPATGGGRVVALISDLVLWCILFAGLLSMTSLKWLKTAFAAFIVLSIGVRIASSLVGLRVFMPWNFICTSLVVLAMLVVILRLVYSAGPVTAHRIRGAVAAYLLIGALFARIYALINYLVPGSFNVASTLTTFRGQDAEAFYYFSVVTLTTVGFGDITAVFPAARSFVMVEALMGQLYPAILIARLVSLAVIDKTK